LDPNELLRMLAIENPSLMQRLVITLELGKFINRVKKHPAPADYLVRCLKATEGVT